MIFSVQMAEGSPSDGGRRLTNNMADLKTCPFCGAMLEYEEHVAILVQGQPTLQLWAHPAGECILSGLEISKEDHEAWNRRAE